jgi:Tetracyclin repressor-like, C-terminal domain
VAHKSTPYALDAQFAPTYRLLSTSIEVTRFGSLQADGTFRADVDPIDVHMGIAALGIFNVTNQFTFGAIFQRAMGAKGDVPGRRRRVADIILRWLKPESVF